MGKPRARVREERPSSGRTVGNGGEGVELEAPFFQVYSLMTAHFENLSAFKDEHNPVVEVDRSVCLMTGFHLCLDTWFDFLVKNIAGQIMGGCI